jgi:hypothetical protein
MRPAKKQVIPEFQMPNQEQPHGCLRWSGFSMLLLFPPDGWFGRLGSGNRRIETGDKDIPHFLGLGIWGCGKSGLEACGGLLIWNFKSVLYLR